MGFHAVGDLLEVDVDALSKAPEIGDAAAAVLEATRFEVERRRNGNR